MDLEALDSTSPNILFPHLYRNSITYGIYDSLPQKTQALLRDTTYRLIAADLKNSQWIKKNLASFESEKIPVILLKGAAFSASLYPESTPRLGVDIDLLVSEENFDHACSLISLTMNPVLLDDTRTVTHETLFERVFTPKTGKSPTVEIHWRLTNPYIFTIIENLLWDASRQHPAYNSEYIRILSPEDTLLHLATHAFRDLDFCTHNLLDAHEVWCRWTPDTALLLERAQQWGAKNVLFYLLANCRAIMDTPIPEAFLIKLKPSRARSYINRRILQANWIDRQGKKNAKLYRLVQLLSQLTFPDKITNGLKFQFSYLNVRRKDWLSSRKKLSRLAS